MEKKEISEESKWEAKFTATLKNSSPDKIWSFLEDYFGFEKYFPGLTVCNGISGNNGEIGAIRYCAGEFKSAGGEMIVSWANERLNAIDKDEKVIVYEFLENNGGFTNFICSIKVIPLKNGSGCVLEWTISLDPVNGMTYEQLVNRNGPILEKMAEKMEHAALNG